MTFVSLWDGGYEISDSATLDLDSGIVSDIETLNLEDDVETLDGEFVQIDDLPATVVSDDNTDYAFKDQADLAVFAARISGPLPGSR